MLSAILPQVGYNSEMAPRKYFVEIGQRFGRGVVIDPEIRTGMTRAVPRGVFGARLRCDCGTEYEARVHNLFAGKTVSCGCQRRDNGRELHRTWGDLGRAPVHGMKPRSGQHPLYGTWNGMMQRCTNPKQGAWDYYGGRGITVCERWHDVRLFVEDVERDLGARPAGCTLDRIDNDGDYEPGNVRWATGQEQQANTRRRADVRGS